MTLTSFTVATAAEAIAVSQDVIRSLIRSGELRAFDAGFGRGKKRWRITATALDEFIRRRSNDPEPKSTPRRRRAQAKDVTRYY